MLPLHQAVDGLGPSLARVVIGAHMLTWDGYVSGVESKHWQGDAWCVSGRAPGQLHSSGRSTSSARRTAWVPELELALFLLRAVGSGTTAMWMGGTLRSSASVEMPESLATESARGVQVCRRVRGWTLWLSWCRGVVFHVLSRGDSGLLCFNNETGLLDKIKDNLT